MSEEIAESIEYSLEDWENIWKDKVQNIVTRLYSLLKNMKIFNFLSKLLMMFISISKKHEPPYRSNQTKDNFLD